VDSLAKKTKPIIKELIQYYYRTNNAGGNCHVVLDDGNLEVDTIQFCLEECKNANDCMGSLIMETLLEFAEEERETMFDSDWWGMVGK